MQYCDYAIWQENLLASPDAGAAAQLAYWRAALGGLPERTELPTDKVYPAVAGYEGGGVGFEVPAGAHQKLIELARSQGATMFMVAHAALAGLLSRLGAGADIAIGSPIAGRLDPALDDLVGFFVNTLVLRLSTAGSPSFKDLLLRAREADLGAYANQDLPFEELVEDLAPARSLSHHPLFQVMLTFDNLPEAALALEGLEAEPMGSGLDVAKFDLTLSLRERPRAPVLPPGWPVGCRTAATSSAPSRPKLWPSDSCACSWEPPRTHSCRSGA